MSASIPTEPPPDRAENVMAAIAHGMSGDMETGLGMLKPFTLEGAPGMASLCATLSECIAMNARKQNPQAHTFGYIAFAGGSQVDLRSASAAERFAAQYSAAWINRQQETAHALFRAVHDGLDRDKAAETLADGVMILYRQAIAAMLEFTEETREKRKRAS